MTPFRESTLRAPQLIDFAAALADLARSWQAEESVERVIGAVVAGTDIVPGARAASLSLLAPRRRLSPAAHSDELIGAIDRAQCGIGEGPAFQAAFHGDSCRTADLGADGRWPAFGPLAAGMGLRSMLSCPLVVGGERLGALTLASDRTAAFDEPAELLSGLFAAHAAIALSAGRRDQQLREAVASRDLIGQAKGILMQRHRISGDEAFATLVQASQDTNMKLREVAGHVVDHIEQSAGKARRDRLLAGAGRGPGQPPRGRSPEPAVASNGGGQVRDTARIGGGVGGRLAESFLRLGREAADGCS